YIYQKMMGSFSCLCCLLLFFLIVPSPSNSLSSPPPPPLCHPHESSALLQFRNSFSNLNYSYSFCGSAANPNSTISWDMDMSRDCCTWSGVTCDEAAGRVIRLDLECSGLQGILDSNNTLFSLGHLQSLDLSGNYFYGSEISSQFGRFPNMIHLDLSNSGFTGQVPLELSYLSNLVTLDLRSYYTSVVKLETSSWKRIVANLTNLQELFLSGVNMSSVLPNSFMNLSTSLTTLYLSEYFISENGLKGEFPENIFNLPNLQELDLSGNADLNGSFPQYNWSSPL
ncbi:LRR domain containing protein, partial [Trema orientale]